MDSRRLSRCLLLPQAVECEEVARRTARIGQKRRAGILCSRTSLGHTRAYATPNEAQLGNMMVFERMPLITT